MRRACSIPGCDGKHKSRGWCNMHYLRWQRTRHPLGREHNGILWTEEAIVEAIRDWTAEHGRSPSDADWSTAGRGHPASITVRAKFGTLAKAREAAGVTFQRKNHAGDWTRETVAETYVKWVFEHGRQPRAEEWQRATPTTPGCSTVRRLYGSWNIMVASIGYQPRYMRRSVQGYLNAGRTRVMVAREDGWEARRARYLEALVRAES